MDNRNNNNLNNYVLYLNFLNEKLAKFFESQKPYIFCKKGCGKCCKNSQFPYSLTETVFLLEGAKKLDSETQIIVTDNINKVKLEKENFKGEVFEYDCPFLINNECSVYEYRGVICRSFGLMTLGPDEKPRIPFCCKEGGNYSNVVIDGDINISSEKFKKLGVKEVPSAFHTNYKFLTDPDFEKMFGFKFGEVKPLIDWL